jgi:ribosomal-protein-alanine N-acetyltransferase
MDATIEIITKGNYTEEKLEKVVSFLYEYLDQYGDDRKYIRKAVDYAMAIDGRPGGFIVHA